MTEEELTIFYASIEYIFEDWEITQYFNAAKEDLVKFSKMFRKSLTNARTYCTDEEKKQFNEGLNEYIRKM